MIGSLIAIMLLGGQTVPEQCSAVVPHPSGSGFTHYPAPGYTVANAVPPLSLPQGLGEVILVVCSRETLILTDNDFRMVGNLGVPLTIGAEGVIGSLEQVEGRFQFNVTRGELSPAQAEVIEAALQRGQLLREAEQFGTE